jgi:putative transposase
LQRVIHDLDAKLYNLYCYTIMPNHIHLLLKPVVIDGMVVSLAKIVKDIKGISARIINQVLEQKGSLWAREYYDYWVRNEEEFNNLVNYIRHNPVQAGFVIEAKDWQWTWINPDLVGKE